MSIPDFLPNLLSLDSDNDEQIEYLYSIFQRDFIENVPKYNNLPVYHDIRILPNRNGKEEGFWHLITKENNINKERYFNRHRARHLHWIKLLIENIDRYEVYPFEHDSGNKSKGIRSYIWLRDYGYICILKKFKRSYTIITAYPIEYVNYRRDVQKMYDNRLQ